MIARVLIAQNANHAPFAQQSDGRVKSFPPIEKLDPGARAFPSNIGVDPTIAERLIDRGQRDVAEIFWKELREQFPAPHMAENENDRFP